MATFFKRREGGKWWVAYVDETKRRRYLSSGSTEYRSAVNFAAKLETKAAERRRGVRNADEERRIGADRVPLRDHSDEYVRHLKLRERSHRHVLDVERVVGKLDELLGVSRLSDVTTNAIERYLEVLKGRNCGSRTLNLHQVLIGGFLA